MNIDSRVSSLRKEMKADNIDAFIIPSSDNHGSEYVSKYFRVREWISGFTGSAGTVVITAKEAHLWTDGRYFLQAAEQIKGTEFVLEKMGEPGVKTYIEWIVDNLDKGSNVSFNGKVFTVAQLHQLKAAFGEKSINIKPQADLFNDLWKDRPAMPDGKLYIHDVKFAGKSIKEKLDEVRADLKKNHTQSFLLSSLDDIAWLLNLRGSDVTCNPVFLSYLLMDAEKCTLYVDMAKVNAEVKKYLNDNSVEVKNYEDVISDLKDVKGTITLDPNKTNVWLLNAIDSNVEIQERMAVTTVLKAKKNKVEIKNIENAHVKDGVAMVKFLKWLDENVKNGDLTEISVSEKLRGFREEGKDFKDVSFGTIAGYGPHGAIIHYTATEETDVKLQPKGLLLVDSGAQYLDGTTDITRTIALGELTQEEMDDYTLVLRGHLDLGNALFLEGTQGCKLDILARTPLWNRLMDFKHGTGHGVGFFLNVHEGPQQIRRDMSNIALEEGMLTSNEPGIYKAGKHGVRIENLVIVEPRTENEYGKFMGFNTVTLCPYELRAINKALLSPDEITWLNEYHERVYKTLSPFLNNEENAWLKNATRAI